MCVCLCARQIYQVIIDEEKSKREKSEPSECSSLCRGAKTQRSSLCVCSENELRKGEEEEEEEAPTGNDCCHL